MGSKRSEIVTIYPHQKVVEGYKVWFFNKQKKKITKTKKRMITSEVGAVAVVDEQDHLYLDCLISLHNIKVN